MDTILRLPSGTRAWNVDGSSSDRLIDEDGRTVSWISYWRQVTGKTASKCGYAYCDRVATDGGHLWIQCKRRYAIVPICKPCNRPSNVSRQQQADGCQPTLRAVVAVQITKTADMRSAPRRLAHARVRQAPYKKCATRECVECGESLRGRPKSHTLCYECFCYTDSE